VIVTAGCMLCSRYVNKAFEREFLTLIHICVKNIFICCDFEGHINVGRGAHPALGPPVGLP